MKNASIKHRLLNLEAKIDTHLFGVYRGTDGKFYKEDGTEAGNGVGTALKAGAAVGGVGAAVYGANRGHQAIQAAGGYKKVGMDAVEKARPVVAAAGTKIAQGAGVAAGAVKDRAAIGTAAFRKGVAREGGMLSKKGILRGLRGGIAAVTGGRVRLESKIRDKAINLAAKIDDAITL